MSETADEVVGLLTRITQPQFRGQLRARGLARATIWREGVLPPESPQFAETLTDDLLDYGFTLLRAALTGQDLTNDPVTRRAFELAAESIESVIRNGPVTNESGFFRVCSAAAYHLAGYSARAFSLMRGHVQGANLSPSERALALLILRDLDSMRNELKRELELPDRQDETLAAAVQSADGDIDVEDVLVIALSDHFRRALAVFDHPLRTGFNEAANRAVQMMQDGASVAERRNFVLHWWLFTIAYHLLRGLWDTSLHNRLPVGGPDLGNWTRLRRSFISVLYRRRIAEIELWPSQLEAAARALDPTDDLVVALPTSAGKTRIAEICVLRALADEKRALIVTPLRALSAQSERIYRNTFGPLGFSVSSLYGAAGATSGDLDTLANRHIVIATPEKLDFALRNNPALLDDVGIVVLDEGHLIGPNEREIRYEVLVQRLLRRPDSDSRRIVCISAVLPDGTELSDFVGWIRQDTPGGAVKSLWRPTRQRFGGITWRGSHARLDLKIEDQGGFIERFVSQRSPTRGRRRKPFPSDNRELVIASAWRLIEDGQTVLIFSAERRSVEPLAECVLDMIQQGFVSSLVQPDSDELKQALNVGREWLGAEHPAVKCLAAGVAVHHGRLPRPFLKEIQTLLQTGFLKLTIASPTLAQGLNLSASTLLVPSIFRAGSRISSEEFANVVGRAGRAYVDTDGQVLHVVFDSDRRRFRRKLTQWGKLVNETRARTVESGLFRLIAQLIDEMSQTVDMKRSDLIEYLANTPAAWQLHGQTNDDSDESDDSSSSRLARLDAALLSLIEPLNCQPEDIATILDRALEQSLWARRLQRLDADGRRLQQAVLNGRARMIWSETSEVQRRGYFCAGVGLSTGLYLDEHSERLTALLLQADASMLVGDAAALVEALIEFASLVFQVRPFKTTSLAPNWQDVLRVWLRGVPVGEISRLSGTEAIACIEDALSYRLVWALEAVRVRGVAHELLSTDTVGYAALALESGVNILPAALLIQAGFSSRVGSLKAVLDAAGEFTDFSSMRNWLGSELVIEMSRDQNWPTPETSEAWRAFRESGLDGTSRMWTEHSFATHLATSLNPDLRPEQLQFIHDEIGAETWIYPDDMRRVGKLLQPFSHEPSGLLTIEAIDGADLLRLNYFGPDFRTL